MSGGHSPRVLVAGDDYYASLATVRGLRAGGYEPWFAAYSRLTFAARSLATAGTFAVPRPSAGDDAYVAALAEAARRCKAAVVLPCNELAIKALAGREDLFPADTVLGTNSKDVVGRTTDKTVLAELATEAGVSAPHSIEIDADNLSERIGEISFPAVIKPATSAVAEADRTWVAPPAQLVSSREALEQVAPGAPRLLVQPYIAGVLTAVAGVAWRGEVACTAHQVAQRIYPEALGVSAYAETVPIDPELDGALAGIVRRLGWSGIFEFQLIRADDGPHVIDLNPRPYGSLALAIAAGLNLPTIWVDLLLGREPRVGAYSAGVRYRAEIHEGRAVVAALAQRRPLAALAILRPRRRTVHSIFSARDPMPMLVVLERAARKVVERVCRPRA